jgi:inorganic triphosphatase YgiF
MAQERELKFGIAEGDLQMLQGHPVLGMFAPAPRLQRLETVYFDVDGDRLAAAGLVLRLRRTADGHRVTVKSSGSDSFGHLRGEWEWPTCSETLSPADLERALRETPLQQLGLDAAALQAALRPVFGTAFDRLAWEVDWEGSRIEVALDRGACTAWRDGAPRSTPLCEVELELHSGEWRHCWELAWALAQDVALLASPVNKAQRAGALRAGARIAALPEPSRVAPGTTLRDAARLWLSTAAAQLAVWGERIRDADEERDVHQYRVVLRRLRTVLRWLEPHARKRASRWFEGETRWAMQVAGPVRDADVWLQRLRELRDLHPDAVPAQLLDALEGQRQQRRALLRGYLGSPRFGRLLLALARWAEQWSAHDGGRGSLQRLAVQALRDDEAQWQRALDACAEALARAARGEPTRHTAPLHTLRICSKRLRLSVERLAHLLPAPRAELLRQRGRLAEQLQTHLGNWHDAQRLRERAVQLAPQARDIDSRLHAVATQAVAAAQQALAAG